MYRVVLADDEKWSLYGLSQMICWADYQCEICGMAYDGLSALDLCRREKPDLLISDIRMPGMDGLELTRCIALEMPRTTVILITGYSDLKYAQQALRLGVFDFLLKQITPGDLDQMLRRYQENMQKKARALSCSFYFSFFDESNTRSIADCMEDLCVQVPFQKACAMTFQYNEPVVISHALVHQQEDELLIAFLTGCNLITVFCFSDGSFSGSQAVYKRLMIGIPERVGISESCPTSAAFFTTYRQSILAVLTAQFWHISTPVQYYRWLQNDTLQHLESIHAFVSVKNVAGATMALDSLLCSRQRMQIDQMDLLIHRAASLCASHGLAELSFLENLDLYQYVSSGGTWEDLSSELHAAQHGDDASDESSRLMRRIMHYIDLHYAEDIRISDLAVSFYLNASYMSTLIRKKTGKTYTDIIAEKRIDCAKKLLRSTDETVLEVAHMVGYHEYAHFNTLFKRMCGMTPAQYRKQMDRLPSASCEDNHCY